MVLPQKDLPDQIQRTSWRRNVNTTSAPTSKCSSLWFIKSPASDAVCFQIQLRRERKENETGSPRVRTKLCVHVSPCRQSLFIRQVGIGLWGGIVLTPSPQRSKQHLDFSMHNQRLGSQHLWRGCMQSGAPTDELSGGSSLDSEGLGEKSHGPVSVTCRRCGFDWGKPARYRQRAALLPVFQQERERRKTTEYMHFFPRCLKFPLAL